VGSIARRTPTPRLAGRAILLGAALLTCALLPAPATAADRASTRVTVAGCGGGVPIAQRLAAAFSATRPGVQFEFAVVGSTAGIALATAGAVDLAVTSRGLRTEEEDITLVLAPFARTAVVVAAHPTVPVAGLTTPELLEIFRGSTVRWASGERITLVTREWGESVVEDLRARVVGFAQAYAEGVDRPHTRLVYSEPALHRALRTIPYAVGLSSAGALALDGTGLKALALDGVAPTPERIASGHYPLSQTLAFLLRDDLASRAVQDFVTFVRSDAVRPLLQRHGYLPVTVR
jgi:phosphate transport system substrate-binding protein